MRLGLNSPAEPRAYSTVMPPEHDDEPHSMSAHVIGLIGLHIGTPDDACPNDLHLHLSPALMEPDGHVDFGALGVYLDLASSRAGFDAPFVHADLSIHRIDRPGGQLLLTDVRVLRRGGRSAVVHVACRDELGTRVADSTQQIVFVKSRASFSEASSKRWTDFLASLDGVCRLTGPLHDTVGLVAARDADGAPVSTLALAPINMNGYGGLHGGVAFEVAIEAAVRAAADGGCPADPLGAVLRYLAPADVGPVRAVATVMPQGGDSTYVRVELRDDGRRDADGEASLCIVAEVHLG